MYGLTVNPSSTAFFASRPAPSITLQIYKFITLQIYRFITLQIYRFITGQIYRLITLQIVATKYRLPQKEEMREK